MKDIVHRRLLRRLSAGCALAAAAGAHAAYPSLTLASTDTRAVPTFESIGVYWTFKTTQKITGCRLQYRKSGETAWREGLALWYDGRNRECRGSLVQLAPGTSYDLQLSLPGQSPARQLRVSTWSENFPVASTVTAPPGTSQLMLDITQGGMPGAYALYTTDPDTPSVIDAQNAQAYNVRISASYVIVRGLTLKNAQQDAIRIMDGAHDVIIEDNDISGWGRSSGTKSKAGYIIGVDKDSGVRAVCTTQTLVRIVVQRNLIHDPRYGANSWSEGHPIGPQGITFDACGGNDVFRYNEIYSTPGNTAGHYFDDAISGSPNFSTTGYPNADSDIYGNLIETAWDNCIEAEGGNRNVRIWGNYCNNAGIPIASTTTSVGPLYIFRNVVNRSRYYELSSLDNDLRQAFAKAGTDPTYGAGRRYIFHNTLLQATDPSAVYGLGSGQGVTGTSNNGPIQNTISRNNIYQLWKTTATTFSQSGTGNDYDFDLYNGVLGTGVAEAHGIPGTPVYAPGNGWTSEDGGMYQQDPASPGYDAGVRIPNFNDGFIGAAPDIGAHEAGAPAMTFGVQGGR